MSSSLSLPTPDNRGTYMLSELDSHKAYALFANIGDTTHLIWRGYTHTLLVHTAAKHQLII